MATIITLHSFRGGTGKTLVAANLAALLANAGHRVALVDAGLHAPAAHILFGLRSPDVKFTLNDYLWGQCEIRQAAYDVTRRLGGDGLLQTRELPAGRLFLVPGAMDAAEIARLVRDRYEVGLLGDGVRDLIEKLSLDVLILDTHPGLHDDTLLAVSLADVLVVLVRPDQQDFESTALSMELARKLEVPRTLVLVNKLPANLSADSLRQRMEQTYQRPVVGFLPLSTDVAAIASSRLFITRYADHPISAQLRDLARRLIEVPPTAP